MVKYVFLIALLSSCKMSIDFDHDEKVKLEKQKIESCPTLQKGFNTAGKNLKTCIYNASKRENAEHIDVCLWIYGIVKNPPEGYL